MLGREHRLDRSAGHEETLAEQSRMGRRWRHLLEVVGGEHDDQLRVVGRRPLDRSDQRLTRGEVEPGRGLVEHEHARLAEHRSGEQHPLSLTLATRGEHPVGEGAAPDGLQTPARSSAVVLPVGLKPRRQGGSLSRQHQVDDAKLRREDLRERVTRVAHVRMHRAHVATSEGEAEHAGRARRRLSARTRSTENNVVFPPPLGPMQRPSARPRRCAGIWGRAPRARRCARRRRAARPQSLRYASSFAPGG